MIIGKIEFIFEILNLYIKILLLLQFKVLDAVVFQSILLFFFLIRVFQTAKKGPWVTLGDSLPAGLGVKC